MGVSSPLRGADPDPRRSVFLQGPTPVSALTSLTDGLQSVSWNTHCPPQIAFGHGVIPAMENTLGHSSFRYPAFSLYSYWVKKQLCFFSFFLPGRECGRALCISMRAYVEPKLGGHEGTTESGVLLDPAKSLNRNHSHRTNKCSDLGDLLLE